ncbi:hypothetical protein NC653_040996 [Populus alba x Populus x berolinensis]|uniref:Uncharacterized protein n=1 Tax=Populus alba x Populus x berolinensis TaxID=444605 RepID=A0AAD6L7F9_9ROSI|nr:hypothetical protein NC653_040996 [Populus alba x Populus x berolinensis]
MTKDQISPPLCSMAEPPADMATWRVALRREREGFGLIESSDPCSDKIK